MEFDRLDPVAWDAGLMIAVRMLEGALPLSCAQLHWPQIMLAAAGALGAAAHIQHRRRETPARGKPRDRSRVALG